MRKLEKINMKKKGLQNRLGAKLPLCILVDTSGSMKKNNNIDKLNEGLNIYRQQMLLDKVACDHIEIALISFGNGGTNLAVDFEDIKDQKFPVFTADEGTPMCEAINLGLDTLEEQMKIYAEEGISNHPPHLIIMTDGYPTASGQYDSEGYAIPLEKDSLELKRTLVKFEKFKAEYNLVSIGVGVELDDRYYLDLFASSPENVLKMGDEENIVEFFKLLSKSSSVLSRAVPNPNNKIELKKQDDQGLFKPWQKINS